MKEHIEESCKFLAPIGEASRKLDVFYNPVMKFNRDITISFLNNYDIKDMTMLDLMAGSGVRSIRFLKELKKIKIKNLIINDYDIDAVDLINKNLRLNFADKDVEKLMNSDKLIVQQNDANKTLEDSKGLYYIDVDPFGSPNPFLENVFKRISRGGIVAITATDTAPLAGTYPKACSRKYNARPMKNEHMHELGLRILIKKCQVVAAQYDKAAIPVVSFYKDHYFRVFFKVEKGKIKTDDVLSQHKYFLYCPHCCTHKVSIFNYFLCCDKKMDFAGPLYVGPINETKLLSKMKNSFDSTEYVKHLELLYNESTLNFTGFFDLHKLYKKYKIHPIKNEKITAVLDSKKIKWSLTHFDVYGMKVDCELDEFVKILKIIENK